MKIKKNEPTTISSHIMLWGRAGGRCSIASCRKELLLELHLEDADASINNYCFIHGWGSDRPRATMTIRYPHALQYKNQILLCEDHCNEALELESAYTLEQLIDEKANHEDYISKQPNFDEKAQNENEAHGPYFERWFHMARIDKWSDWSSNVLKRPACTIPIELFEDLLVLNAEMAFWEHRMPTCHLEIVAAFSNFQNQLDKLLWIIRRCREYPNDSNAYVITKPSRMEYDDSRGVNYHQHVALSNYPGEDIDWLIVNLTKAANHIVDLGTQHLLPSLRKIIGKLTIAVTSDGDYLNTEIPPEYSLAEKEEVYANWLNDERSIKLWNRDYF